MNPSRVTLLISGTILIGGVLSSSALAQGTSRPCEPPGGVQAETVARANTSVGGEVTEYFGGDHYRITRCDFSGNLTISQTVAPVRVPGGKAAVPIDVTRPVAGGFQTTSMLYGDAHDSRWADAWQRHGARIRKSVIPATDPEPASAVDASSASTTTGGECVEAEYHLSGGKWELRAYAYHIYWNSIPGVKASLRDRIIDGHNSWAQTLNYCGFNDQNNIQPTYAGDVARGANPSASDLFNVIDFAPLTGSCAGALACAYRWWNPSGSMYEVDIRFDPSFHWWGNNRSDALRLVRPVGSRRARGRACDRASARALVTVAHYVSVQQLGGYERPDARPGRRARNARSVPGLRV
jgi:hypothetical protein